MISIPLTKGKLAVIDDEDQRFARFRWYAQYGDGRWYAARRKGSGIVFLHREVMGLPGKKKIDHRDGNGLNCQRANLRVATTAQNAANQKRRVDNSTGFKGVSWDGRGRGRWRAQIKVQGKNTHLGGYSSAEDAALAYDAAARKAFGKFAALNFPMAMERAAAA